MAFLIYSALASLLLALAAASLLPLVAGEPAGFDPAQTGAFWGVGFLSSLLAHLAQERLPRQIGRSTAGTEEGAVKWFNVNKGYGFIVRDAGGEIFVHYRGIKGRGRRALEEGQRVRFTVAQTEKGPQADHVEPLG